MAYMHKTTFEIYDTSAIIPAHDVVLQEQFFHVDEIIALPIQALNRKGYTTTFCCSGHPFVPYAAFQIGYEIKKAVVNSYISFEKGIVLPTLPPGFVIRDMTQSSGIKNSNNVFIPMTAKEFDKFINEQDLQVTSPELQKMFDTIGSSSPVVTHTIIDKQYHCDGFELMREILDSMETLYQWALELPDVVA